MLTHPATMVRLITLGPPLRRCRLCARLFVLVDGPERRCIGEQVDHASQGQALPFQIVGSSNGRTNIESSDDLARWSCRTAQSRHYAYQYCGNPSRFQASCDQTHGLMTDGSARNEEYRLDIIGLECGDNLGNGLPDQDGSIGLKTHQNQCIG